MAWLAFFLGVLIGFALAAVCQVSGRQNDCMECQEALLRTMTQAKNGADDSDDSLSASDQAEDGRLNDVSRQNRH
jgi:hypothetical protein